MTRTHLTASVARADIVGAVLTASLLRRSTYVKLARLSCLSKLNARSKRTRAESPLSVLHLDQSPGGEVCVGGPSCCQARLTTLGTGMATNVESVLNELIETSKDGESGFRKAAND